MPINKLLAQIERNLKKVDMTLDNDSWRDTVPSVHGWYFIETNAPPEVLKDLGPPKGERHYNIPAKINASLALQEFGFCILPSNDSFYYVYSGEARNLKARAREHVSGHSKTGCLALGNYPVLRNYSWRFHFAACSFVKKADDSKLLRVFGEQIWRSKYGWPILCGK